MAGIDKTYVTGKQYRQVLEWVNTVKYAEIPYYGKFQLNDMVNIQSNIKDDDTDIVLWNTPYWFDVWLKGNCPLDFIQERLKIQYPTSYDKMYYDDQYIFTKGKYDNNIKLLCKSLGKRGKYILDIRLPEGFYLIYDSKKEYFSYMASFPADGEDRNICSIKALYRFVKHYSFPKGTKVFITNYKKRVYDKLIAEYR